MFCKTLIFYTFLAMYSALLTGNIPIDKYVIFGCRVSIYVLRKCAKVSFTQLS